MVLVNFILILNPCYFFDLYFSKKTEPLDAEGATYSIYSLRYLWLFLFLYYYLPIPIIMSFSGAGLALSCPYKIINLKNIHEGEALKWYDKRILTLVKCQNLIIRI